ncbi:hypothetical protein CN423_02125 [Bacillus cereus]|nr:hypothetical protein CN466_06915 [Bacillus cereus]RGP99035.1 hypothetical protein D1166_15550 [Bacillus sp. ISO11]PES12740.1 hypothetical protein CN501_16450 [Bacillus cereus]PEV68922.1 hypothetical protein CN423_02125 [Bacillus cereus]PFD80991.1 hypothetical protein CN313_14195 [Bacillus cereus]
MNFLIGVKAAIFSVKIDKTTLNSLNFNTIDCSDSMVNFKYNINFKKTKGFELVSKLEKNQENIF